MPLSNLTAVNIVQSLKKGELTCEELVTNYIDHINKYEKNVQAWEFFDETLILKQAKKLDQDHQSGKVHGDLHGVPVGIKDIFDTENMPTSDGTEIHKENPSWNDCTVVSKLKQAGAIPDESIMIGDDLSVDVLGARKAGIKSVFFNPMRIKHNEDIVYEISCLSELMNLL